MRARKKTPFELRLLNQGELKTEVQKARFKNNLSFVEGIARSICPQNMDGNHFKQIARMVLVKAAILFPEQNPPNEFKFFATTLVKNELKNEIRNESRRLRHIMPMEELSDSKRRKLSSPARNPSEEAMHTELVKEIREAIGKHDFTDYQRKQINIILRALVNNPDLKQRDMVKELQISKPVVSRLYSQLRTAIRNYRMQK